MRRVTFFPPIGYFPAMDRRSLYDDDIYAWTQQQAEALRRLARTGRDLPNELDLENVAEEIEDVGKSELSKVESYIQLALVRLLKAASVPQARAYRKWMIEVRVFRAELLKNLTRDAPECRHGRAMGSGAVEGRGGLAGQRR